jgi:phage terminase small subunit
MDKFPPEFYELKPKRQAFVREWLIDRNGTQAAIRAGYAPKSANEQASQLLADLSVKAVVTLIDIQIQKEALEKYAITAEKVLKQLHRLSFYDIRKLYDENNQLKPPSEWDEDTAVAIAGVEIFEEYQGKGENREKIGETKKVKIVDMKGPLELLGKYLKLFNDVGSKENPLEVIHKIERVIVKPG